MDLFSNPIFETLFPVRGILSILLWLFPPHINNGQMSFSAPMLISMAVLGILLIVFGHRVTKPMLPLVSGFVAYWWALHESAQLYGSPNYPQAIGLLLVFALIAILTEWFALSFILAYIGSLLAFVLVLIVFIFFSGLSWTVFGLVGVGIALLLGKRTSPAIRGAIIVISFIIGFILRDTTAILLLAFPLGALLGAELGLTKSVKRLLDPLLSAAATIVGGITGILLLSFVSQAIFAEQADAMIGSVPLALVVGVAAVVITLVLMYRNVSKLLKAYSETDDSQSIGKRFRWLNYAGVVASLLIGGYSLYTFYGALESIEDEENSINVADLTFDQLNPFVLRLPENFQAAMDRYSSYFETPEDITQVASFQIQSFETEQPVYGCLKESCEVLMTMLPGRTFFVLNTITCSGRDTQDDPPMCQARERQEWLEIVVDTRIGWVQMR